MQITNKEYAELAKRRSPNTKAVATSAKAFLIGGCICTVGQLFSSLYQYLGADEKTAGTLTAITLILSAALLTGFKIYEKLARFAGAGTLVPITGFANGVVSSAIEFKSEGYILGVGAKMFIIAGPVIVYGTFTSVVYGILLFIANHI